MIKNNNKLNAKKKKKQTNTKITQGSFPLEHNIKKSLQKKPLYY